MMNIKSEPFDPAVKLVWVADVLGEASVAVRLDGDCKRVVASAGSSAFDLELIDHDSADVLAGQGAGCPADEVSDFVLDPPVQCESVSVNISGASAGAEGVITIYRRMNQ